MFSEALWPNTFDASPSLYDALARPGVNFIDHGRAEAHRAIFDDYCRLCSVRAKGDAGLEVPPHQDFSGFPRSLRTDDSRHSISGAGVTRTNDERIVAAATTKSVYAVSAINDIISQAAIYEIIHIPSDNDVVPGLTVDGVISSVPYDPIMACSRNAAAAVIPVDNVITNSTRDPVIAAA